MSALPVSGLTLMRARFQDSSASESGSDKAVEAWMYGENLPGCIRMKECRCTRALASHCEIVSSLPDPKPGHGINSAFEILGGSRAHVAQLVAPPQLHHLETRCVEHAVMLKLARSVLTGACGRAVDT